MRATRHTTDRTTGPADKACAASAPRQLTTAPTEPPSPAQAAPNASFQLRAQLAAVAELVHQAADPSAPSPEGLQT